MSNDQNLNIKIFLGGLFFLFFTSIKLYLATNKVNSDFGLIVNHARLMDMELFLLKDFDFPKIKAETSTNPNFEPLTNAYMKNWMDCVCKGDSNTNAAVESGYSHSIANIMVTAALRTGQRAAFDKKTKQVMAGEKVFKY